jgi:hypothetical protein
MLRQQELQQLAIKLARQEPGAGIATPDNPQGSVTVTAQHMALAAQKLDEIDHRAISAGYESMRVQHETGIGSAPGDEEKAVKAKLN